MDENTLVQLYNEAGVLFFCGHYKECLPYIKGREYHCSQSGKILFIYLD